MNQYFISIIRSAEELKDTATVDVLFATFWRLPIIYVAMFAARAASIAFFKPLFDLAGSGAHSLYISLLLSALPFCRDTHALSVSVSQRAHTSPTHTFQLRCSIHLVFMLQQYRYVSHISFLCF